MTKEKHVHKFKKIKYKSGTSIFFCTLPDCNVKVNPALALGKRCICWRCGEEFILTEYALRLVKPHCENCHKPTKQVETERREISKAVNSPLNDTLLKFRQEREESEGDI